MKYNVVLCIRQEMKIYYTFCRLNLTVLLNIMGEMGLHRKISTPEIHMTLDKSKKELVAHVYW